MMDMAKLMKQAQNLQKEMAEAKKQIDAKIVSGSAGNGLVKISMSGKGELVSIDIDTSLPNDDILEDLIVAAHQDALNHLEKAKSEVMGSMGGLANQIPGF